MKKIKNLLLLVFLGLSISFVSCGDSAGGPCDEDEGLRLDELVNDLDSTYSFDPSPENCRALKNAVEDLIKETEKCLDKQGAEDYLNYLNEVMDDLPC